MELKVNSEIDQLKGVIVHTPGREVSLVNPELKDELLFDDIIFEDDARQEHIDMLKIFKAAMPEEGKVFEISDLFVESLRQEEARFQLIEKLILRLPEQNVHAIESDLRKLTGEELLQFVVEGTSPSIKNFTLNPTPNLLFTRDLAVIIRDNILISRPAKKARLKESILTEIMIKYHSLFEKVRDRAIHINGEESLEGGDVLVASSDLVLIGMSERTTYSGLMSATEGLLQRGIKYVLAVDIPKQRSSMHLDTIFTFSDRNECIVFPPAITERTDNVVVMSEENGSVKSHSMPSLKKSLEELSGADFTFIKCGGKDRTNQFREQWTDGANVFALAPGIIVGYERNTNTFRELKEHGYHIMNQYEFLEEYSNRTLQPADKKIAISFLGNELCRGRGGARCMTMPIARRT